KWQKEDDKAEELQKNLFLSQNKKLWRNRHVPLASTHELFFVSVVGPAGRIFRGFCVGDGRKNVVCFSSCEPRKKLSLRKQYSGDPDLLAVSEFCCPESLKLSKVMHLQIASRRWKWCRCEAEKFLLMCL
ncbi:hypothetical protein SUGI_0956420, partial [Cryptomeria japonica]